ncbi:MAG: hypothetical protein OQK64_10975 [Ignavibacteriaceae bacterium]|jgi:hypothetical protein|nr:hypothetical protein [Ignavibacteriaceae bacterium]MCW9066015.1 hypothetical protein [Ignavibacteriaceae bacterium]MCW9094523.1 hypothetical protein [Ignavibacteriaceae bacterium]
MNKAEYKNLQTAIETANIPEEERKRLSTQAEKLKSPLDTDVVIYRIVVGSLGLAVLACLTFSFFVTLYNTNPNAKLDMPEIFLAIGSAAVGALAGLLAPSPRKSEGE